ncbi:Retrovirus-related Pol poly from transposon [Brachionus plicatilis]|uniref:Retrovirus-related Pol poly from transposon n=1 Tax=Brachionus plicatilis TaxID=10195 RepID=A0A3M7SS01_BRAPC|nr:Retrovirus-related Pol poly from transposon [Brachionus plicatilis]
METFVYWSSYHRFRIFCKNVFRCLENSDYGTHYQYLVPIDERPAFLKKIHDDPFSGHLGVDKTFEKLKLRFYWPNYSKDTANYILSCEICASIKAPKRYTRQPIVPIQASKPFQLITWDILGPLPATENRFACILVIICHFSKYVELFALLGLTAEEVANCLVLFICRHGVPEAALSDRGTNFQAELMDQLFELLDIKRLRTSAYHPQCDGETERFNRTLEQMLACYVAYTQNKWDQYLPKLAFAYNTAVHATTGLTPFEVVYERKPKLPVDLMFPTPNLELNLSVDSYATKVQQHLLKCYELVERTSGSRIHKFKFYADRNVRPADYTVGDRVWLLNDAKKKGVSKKLSRRWTGPYTVIEKMSDINYRIPPDSKGKKKLVHVNRLKKCNSPPKGKLYDSVTDKTSNPSDETALTHYGKSIGIYSALAEQALESLDEASSKGRTNTPQARSPCLANNSRPHMLDDASLWLDTNYLDLAENEVLSRVQSCSDDLEF